MALIVQPTGACVPDADSWVSLADANAHFAAYGGAWTGADAQKESALRRAALWLSTSIQWAGKASCSAQSMLAWPRTGVIDCNGHHIEHDAVPMAIRMAQLAAASAELVDPGVLTPTVQIGRMVKREKADVVEVEYMTAKDQGIADGGAYDPIAAMRPALTQVNDLISCLTVSANVPWPFVV